MRNSCKLVITDYWQSFDLVVRDEGCRGWNGEGGGNHRLWALTSLLTSLQKSLKVLPPPSAHTIPLDNSRTAPFTKHLGYSVCFYSLYGSFHYNLFMCQMPKGWTACVPRKCQPFRNLFSLYYILHSQKYYPY